MDIDDRNPECEQYDSVIETRLDDPNSNVVIVASRDWSGENEGERTSIIDSVIVVKHDSIEAIETEKVYEEKQVVRREQQIVAQRHHRRQTSSFTICRPRKEKNKRSTRARGRSATTRIRRGVRE